MPNSSAGGQQPWGDQGGHFSMPSSSAGGQQPWGGQGGHFSMPSSSAGGQQPWGGPASAELQLQRGYRIALAAGDVSQADNIKRTKGTPSELGLVKPFPHISGIRTMARVRMLMPYHIAKILVYDTFNPPCRSMSCGSVALMGDHALSPWISLVRQRGGQNFVVALQRLKLCTEPLSQWSRF